MPTWLLAAGLVAGLAVAALARWALNLGASRTQRRVRGQVEAQVAKQVEREVVKPVRAAVAGYERFARDLSVMAAVGQP